MPIGHVLVIALIALVVGALLDAHGLRKTAELQDAGAGRDVAVALSSGLVGISDALGISEPRTAVKAALGRSSDDEISGKVAFARAAARRRAGAPGRRRKAAPAVYGPQHHLRVYVTGDSLLGDPGPALLELAVKTGVMDPAGPADSHPATGLVRPEVFNWFDYLPKQADRLKPDLVVMGFGGNDGQGIPGVPGATEVGSPGWTREYRRRVAGTMDIFTSRGIKVVWVGLPIPRDPGLAKTFRTMNAVYESEAAKRPGNVLYLDMYHRFATAQGRYSDYLPVDGRPQLVRKSDGVHYETPGAQIVAKAILHAIPRIVKIRRR